MRADRDSCSNRPPDTQTDVRVCLETMAKMRVQTMMDTFSRICEVLHCNVGDVMDFVNAEDP